MPILMDYNQTVIANFMESVGNHMNTKADLPMMRHMILNSIQSVRKRNKREFGEIIICADSVKSWRRNAFPYYKANRAKSKEESEIDWIGLYECMDTVRQEIDERFPYPVIQIDGVEADDIIGVICQDNGTVVGSGDGRILINSRDKDFIQLHTYSNVAQMNPISKEFIRNSNPEQFLKTHIIKGDKGDGIPNMLSDADTFVVPGKRQKVMSAKRLASLLEDPTCFGEKAYERYQMNKKLIDLTMIPEDIRKEISDKVSMEVSKDKKAKDIFGYFMEHRLKNLLTNIGEFT